MEDLIREALELGIIFKPINKIPTSLFGFLYFLPQPSSPPNVFEFNDNWSDETFEKKLKKKMDEMKNKSYLTILMKNKLI